MTCALIILVLCICVYIYASGTGYKAGHHDGVIEGGQRARRQINPRTVLTK